MDKRYRPALAEHRAQYETIEKELYGFTLHFPSMEDAYSCAISLLASGEGKQLISFATDMIMIPRVCGVSLSNIVRFKVAESGAKGDDLVSTLNLFLSVLSAKRKYYVGNFSKHEEIYVTVHESTLKEYLLNSLIQNHYTVGK